MKVLYLIDSKEYDYHLTILDDFKSVIPGEHFDRADNVPSAQWFKQVEAFGADAIITFDGTSLQLKTVSDTLSVNNLCPRFAHILFHKASYYGRMLYYRQNLSMFTFLPKGEDIEGAVEKYGDVPNIMEFVEFYYKPSNEKEHDINRAGIALWWDRFRKEAML